jgi:hypothetical protein
LAGTTDANTATDTSITIDTTSSLQTADFDDNSDPAKAWVAVVPATGGTGVQIMAFHYTLDNTTVPAFNSAVDITVVSIPLSITIMYISDSSFYISAMLTNNQGSVYIVTDSGTGSPLVENKIMATGLDGTWFMGETVNTVIVTAANKINAESGGLTKKQGIIYKSKDTLVVTDYNCYDI